jgi:hypothetical protein
MNARSIIGIVLIVAGTLALIYQGVSYTSRETVIAVGPFQATADTRKTLPLPPILGVAAIAGGVALLIMARTRR